MKLTISLFFYMINWIITSSVFGYFCIKSLVNENIIETSIVIISYILIAYTNAFVYEKRRFETQEEDRLINENIEPI